MEWRAARGWSFFKEANSAVAPHKGAAGGVDDGWDKHTVLPGQDERKKVKARE